MFHDPGRAADGRRERQAGGRNRPRSAARLPADTPDDPLGSTAAVSALLAGTINLVPCGQLDPKVANAVGYLAGVQLLSLEQGRTEERVVGVAVTGSTFREVYKSMWLIEKENEMRRSFEAEAAAEMKSTT